MKANMLSIQTPSTPGVGSKGQIIISYESDHVEIEQMYIYIF